MTYREIIPVKINIMCQVQLTKRLEREVTCTKYRLGGRGPALRVANTRPFIQANSNKDSSRIMIIIMPFTTSA